MTDHDLHARLARIETSLQHIQEDVTEAKSERADAVRQTHDFMARLVRLEAGDRALSDIPSRVAHAEAVNEVQEAVKDERTAIIREIRAFVIGGFAIAGVMFSIANYFLGNGQ